MGGIALVNSLIHLMYFLLSNVKRTHLMQYRSTCGYKQSTLMFDSIQNAAAAAAAASHRTLGRCVCTLFVCVHGSQCGYVFLLSSSTAL